MSEKDLLADDILQIGAFKFRNRLFVGTGKYATFELMQQALEQSGCEVVTVAVRRERLLDKQNRNILDFLDTKKYTLLIADHFLIHVCVPYYI